MREDVTHDEGVVIERPVAPSNDSYTRWIVGIVGAGLISGFALLAARDRAAIDLEIARQQRQIETTAAMVTAHEAQLQVLKARQERVLQDLATLDQKIGDNGEKLDRVLYELRKKM